MNIKFSIIVLIMLMTALFSAVIDAATENVVPYPLEYKLSIQPDDVHYGDFVVVSLQMTNAGKEEIIIWSDFSNHGYSYSLFRLYPKGKATKSLQWRDEENAYKLGIWDIPEKDFFYKCVPIVSGKTIEVAYRLLWVPPTGFPGEEFQKTFHDEKAFRDLMYGDSVKPIEDFEISVKIDMKKVVKESQEVNWNYIRFQSESEKQQFKDAIPFSKITEYGYSVPESIDIRESLKIRPRPQEEYELIRKWYHAIPTEHTNWDRVDELFPESLFDPDAPFNILEENRWNNIDSSLDWLKESRDYRKRMFSRSEYSLERIRKSKELASQLIADSQSRDSTISQNMVEFIQLRGLLVEMRYAENEEMEKAAFEKLCEFVMASKDKELWTQFVTEIGFASIQHHEHFPYTKVDKYKNLFRESFDTKP